MSPLDTPSLAVASIMAGQAAQNLGEQISDRTHTIPAGTPSQTGSGLGNERIVEPAAPINQGRI